MTKTRRWPSLLLAAFTVLSFGACEDWGQMDPPAGTDVYPKLEQVYSETFGGNFDPTTSMSLFAYDDGDVPVVVVDEKRDSVLHLPNGYARLFNPLTNYKAQNGVSLTFWVKQALFLDEETEEPLEEDLDGALFSFQNFNGTQNLYMTANGYLKYEGVDGEWESADLLESKTGMLNNAGEWHYVAVTIKDNGYSVYVDGQQRIDKTIPASDFDFNKMVQFMAGCDYIYLGYGSGINTKEMWIDDLTIYRNQITKKEQAVPGSGDEEEVDYSNYIFVGAEDLSTAWWTEFSPIIKMVGDNTTHYGFWNFTTGQEFYHNFSLVITNGKGLGEDGYAEYIVMRSDAWGWGTYWDDGQKANLTHNLNFDTFKTDMNGAWVDIDITREGNKVSIKTCATTADGSKQLIQEYWFEGELSETIGSFLVVDHAHLKVDVEKTIVGGKVYNTGEFIFGNQDFSSGFWSMHTPLQVINGDTSMPLVFVFTNYSKSIDPWNNWNMVVTNGKAIGEDGVAELTVFRSDNWGWGTYWDGGLVEHTHGFIDNGTFISDMHGAYCRIAVERTGGDVTFTIKTRRVDGTLLGDYIVIMHNVAEPQIGLQITPDGSWHEFHAIGYMPFWDYITQ